MDEISIPKIVKSMRLTLDVIKNNPYNKPWKVVYVIYWKTGEPEIYDGKKTVYSIVDCDDREIIETDMGVYGPNEEIAEYIVRCVNEREED